MEPFEVLWFGALPLLIWLALRLGGKLEDGLGQVLWTMFFAAVGWGIWFLSLTSYSEHVALGLGVNWEARDYWLLAAAFPVCTYLSSRIAAKVTVRQAQLASLCALLWCVVFGQLRTYVI
jgi:hypothetical protein